jgi:hypothetical protein
MSSCLSVWMKQSLRLSIKAFAPTSLIPLADSATPTQSVVFTFRIVDTTGHLANVSAAACCDYWRHLKFSYLKHASLVNNIHEINEPLRMCRLTL